jgi:GT2 family glycosyltransferase
LFSIIIPTCNRNDLLALCLQRLQRGAQTLEAALYEVIVSDDGKNNEAKALVADHYPWAKWVEGPKRGPAANRNCGAKLAKGEWLVFTDDDCLPDVNWLKAYKDAIIQHPKCKAFEGAILPDDWELLKKDMAECPVNTTGGCFWSANIMVENALFWQLGGFDESFTSAANEDQELFCRVKEKTVVCYVPKVVVAHPVRIVSLRTKISQLPTSEKSQIKLRLLQKYSFWENWADGIRIHASAGYNALRLRKWKRLMYNTIGFSYRLTFGLILVIKSKF